MAVLLRCWSGQHKAVRQLFGALAALALALSPFGGLTQAWAGCADTVCQPLPTEVAFRPEGEQRWLDVDLAAYEVRFRVGWRIVDRAPVAVGRADTPITTTRPGVFQVVSLADGPSFLPDQGVYVRDWVGFDPGLGNGFHSFPLDARGRILDARVGEKVTAGCVRTPAADRVLRFAQIGMPVVVHEGPIGLPGGGGSLRRASTTGASPRAE